MMYRIYWRTKCAPAYREGGPWWADDFRTKAGRDDFLEAMLPMLSKFALYDKPQAAMPAHDLMSVRPPIGACIQEAAA